jgi:hypothetical protein
MEKLHRRVSIVGMGPREGGREGQGARMSEDVNLYPRHGDSAVVRKSCGAVTDVLQVY